jgi:hypothetical protein
LTAEESQAAAQWYLPAESYIHFTALPTDTSYLAPAKPNTMAPGGSGHTRIAERRR